MNQIRRASLGTIRGTRFAVFASRGDIIAVKHRAFGVSATQKLRGGGEFRDERRDLCGVDVGEIASGAEITRSARDPDEAASGVHDERDGLRRRAEAEGDGVAAIAVR